MVLVIGKNGARWHEPPYTEEEKAELLWRMSGPPVAFSSPQHRRPRDTKHAGQPEKQELSFGQHELRTNTVRNPCPRD